MLGRFSAAMLGLFAFSVTIVAGLIAGNGATVTLSRSIAALIIFSLIGWILGIAARAVIGEYHKKKADEIRNRYTAGPGHKEGTDLPEPADAASG